MKLEKTQMLTVDGVPVFVAGLPAELRQQFEIFDAFREELSDIAVKFEMATMAANLKRLQLEEAIRQWKKHAESQAVMPATSEATKA